MISSAIMVNQPCGICYTGKPSYRCTRCTFTLCEKCTSNFKKAIAAENGLCDQCGQCKKEAPWIIKIDLCEKLSQPEPLMIEVLPRSTELPNQLTDVELQSDAIAEVEDASDAGQHQNVHEENQDYKCMSNNTVRKLKKTSYKICYVIMGLMITEILGFAFFAANDNIGIFFDAIEEKNTSQLFILMMMYCLAGVFIILGLSIVIACIGIICGCICIECQSE